MGAGNVAAAPSIPEKQTPDPQMPLPTPEKLAATPAEPRTEAPAGQREYRTGARALLLLEATRQRRLFEEEPGAWENLEPPISPPVRFVSNGRVPASFFRSSHNTQIWALRDAGARRYFSI